MGWVESLLGRALDRAATRARTDSPRAAQLLDELSGKRLAIAIAGTPFGQQPIVVQSTGLSLVVHFTADPAPGAAAAPIHTTLHGAPLSLLALLQDDPQAVIQRGDVRIEGDAQLAQRFEELGRLLAPDLEHALSQMIGRSAAHVLVGGLRAAAGSVRTAAWTSVRNIAEYLAHESGDLVSHQEATHYLHGVEQAREQLDRLEARLGVLERQADGPAGGSEPS